MFDMHPAATRELALALIAQGANDCEIARRLGVARTTVRDWRRRPYVPRVTQAVCPRCWRPSPRIVFTASDYAELLGLYLGDGHITAMPRTERLRLSMDAKYAVIVGETDALLRRCFPSNRISCARRDGGSTAVLSVYNRHLSCLFPQHGPGKKHDRRIVLEPWQVDCVTAAPWAFLRGCIRSDGCAFVNRTGRYEYLAYAFTNVSAEIRDLFVAACLLVDLDVRPGKRTVRVNTRRSVARLLEHVGVKA